jgi:hypothetical protein
MDETIGELLDKCRKNIELTTDGGGGNVRVTRKNIRSERASEGTKHLNNDSVRRQTTTKKPPTYRTG